MTGMDGLIAALAPRRKTFPDSMCETGRGGPLSNDLAEADGGITLNKNDSSGRNTMDIDEPRKSIAAHEIGMDLSALSVEELKERIEMLRAEIARLEQNIDAKSGHLAAAASLFKS